ncbi:hypothetical protein LRU_02173 [Ligilactobacillus ruminis SPM0211]|uniref:Uncharacterized protein n=1 Tax=Ligilactobacillus ruminis SPM0211 TaxID=1040964 RepID=F7R3B4_9LACO|nr:hypothetical protein LRU_02173 [Ligilactobacillus ruminis SPM0211]
MHVLKNKTNCLMKEDTLIQQNFLQKRTLSFRYLKFLLLHAVKVSRH